MTLRLAHGCGRMTVVWEAVAGLREEGAEAASAGGSVLGIS